jgi:hypothetical protein
MSDKGVHYISFEGKVRIIIAGVSESDSIAGMMRHIFNCCGTGLSYNPDFSESDNNTDDIAVICGIGSPDKYEPSGFDENIRLLRKLANSISEGGTLVYDYEDEALRDIASESRGDIRKIPYKMHGYFQNKLGIFAATHNRTVPVTFTGDDNMKSLSAAREACMAAGVSEDDFYEAIKSFVESIS